MTHGSRSSAALAKRILDEFGERLYNTALGLCGHAADAEDLAFRTIERGVEAYGGFDESRPLLPWLIAIMVNFRRMDLRRKSANALEFRDDIESLEIVDEQTPADILDQEENRAAIAAAVERLDPDRRFLILLRFYDELSVPEIAQVLGVPEGTVKSRLHAVLGELRKILSND